MPSITTHQIPGGWSDREVVVGPHRFKLFTPTDPDEVLSQLESPEATTQPHLADPYWAKLWPAAPLLAEAIVRETRSRPANAVAVLELGCGSGLVGLAALASGCNVTFSDYVPFAVELARENAARNGFAAARGLVLDWRQPPDEKFGWIVAADVTYDRANIDPLLSVCEKMLARGGQAWFGDAGRGPAEEFILRAQIRGWIVALYDERGEPAECFVLGSYRQIVLRAAA